MHSFKCYKCGTDISTSTLRLGRSESCHKCSSDLHACYQCRFYDAKSYNECREPQAERVTDKAKANYCDYFEAASATANQNNDPAEAARKKLEDLFK
jgi:hypothetical protein